MNRRDFVISALIAAGGCVSRISAQTKVIEVDLSKLVDGKGLKVFNRNVSSFSDGPRRGLRLDAARGEGIAYLQGVEFANGSIELDIRGKEVREQSFVGVAFHGVDGTTYDAVYFRPFNFRAEDPVRRSHAVQYISSPIYKWQKLRTEHPGKYENAVNPVPDPNEWFHARIVVASPKSERVRGRRERTQPGRRPVKRPRERTDRFMGGQLRRRFR